MRSSVWMIDRAYPKRPFAALPAPPWCDKVLASSPYQKARLRVARLRAKFARRRKDALHKCDHGDRQEPGVIIIEDLK
jgi:hypothetical protein